jgi:hypothetical protein
VTAPPGRYGSDGEGRPTAAIRRSCGHEEGLGVLWGRAFPETEVAQLALQTVAPDDLDA